jgi:hypothetical protein
LFVATIVSTSTPSDSRCARLDFAVGSYEALRPDVGHADGPLAFRPYSVSVVEEFLRQGFTTEGIGKIDGGNFGRVFGGVKGA